MQGGCFEPIQNSATAFLLLDAADGLSSPSGKKNQDLGANSLLLAYGDKLPFSRHLEIANPNAFGLDGLKDFVTYAESVGPELIPLVQSLRR